MCLQPADVTKVICLFYEKLLEFIATEQYGVNCDNEDTINEIKLIWSQYEFGCYTNDYIRELIIDEAADMTFCDRDTFVEDGG